MSLPTITDATPTDYQRRNPITLSDIEQPVRRYAQYLASTRTQCLWSYSWVYNNSGSVATWSYDISGGITAEDLFEVMITPQCPRISLITAAAFGSFVVDAYSGAGQSGAHLWRAVHDHTGFSQSIKQTTWWVDPGTTIYLAVQVDDDGVGGDLVPVMAQVWEDPLEPADLRIDPPDYGTVASASAACGTSSRSVASINGELMVCRPASEMEGFSEARWVPWHWRNAQFDIGYQGGTAYDASPNDDYSWTLTSTGGTTISHTSDITYMADTSGGLTISADTRQYWWNQLVYAKVKPYDGGADHTPNFEVESANDVKAYVSLGEGAAGVLRVLSGLASYTVGSTVYTEIQIEVDYDVRLVTVRDYQTQALIGAQDYTDLGASSDAALTVNVGENGAIFLQGDPAIAVYTKWSNLD